MAARPVSLPWEMVILESALKVGNVDGSAAAGGADGCALRLRLLLL